MVLSRLQHAERCRIAFAKNLQLWLCLPHDVTMPAFGNTIGNHLTFLMQVLGRFLANPSACRTQSKPALGFLVRLIFSRDIFNMPVDVFETHFSRPTQGQISASRVGWLRKCKEVEAASPNASIVMPCVNGFVGQITGR